MPETLYVSVEVDSHKGFQLPLGKHQAVLGIVHVRLGILHIHLSPYHIVFGNPAALVFGLGLAVILLCIAVILLVDIAEIGSQKAGIESLFHLIYKVLAALAGFLNGKVHTLSGNVQASPQRHVHKRHGSVESS